MQLSSPLFLQGAFLFLDMLQASPPFYIFIRFNGRHYRYRVEHAIISEREEHFTIRAKNKTLVISSNRPLFRNRGLKHRRPDYKLIEGAVWNISYMGMIYEQIDAVVNK